MSLRNHLEKAKDMYPDNLFELLEEYADPDSFSFNMDSFEFIKGNVFNRYQDIPNAWVSCNGYILFTNKCRENIFLYYTGSDNAKHLFRLGNLSLYYVGIERASYIINFNKTKNEDSSNRT